MQDELRTVSMSALHENIWSRLRRPDRVTSIQSGPKTATSHALLTSSKRLNQFAWFWHISTPFCYEHIVDSVLLKFIIQNGAKVMQTVKTKSVDSQTEHWPRFSRSSCRPTCLTVQPWISGSAEARKNDFARSSQCGFATIKSRFHFSPLTNEWFIYQKNTKYRMAGTERQRSLLLYVSRNRVRKENVISAQQQLWGGGVWSQ